MTSVRSHPPLHRLLLAVASFLALVVSLVAPGSVLPAGAQEEPAPDTSELDDLEFEDAERVSTANIRVSASGSANARWLSDLYENVFFREADVVGLDHWLALIPAGGEDRRTALTDLFLTSIEGSRGEVLRAYDDVLDRGTDESGEAFWTEYLRTNPVTDLRFELYISDEFYDNAGGTPETFVSELYRRILFREPDSSGFAFWVGELNAGRPRWELVPLIHFSDESMENRTTALYAEALGRQPSAAELAAGVATIRQSDERGLRGQLLASDEAFETYLAAALGN